MTQEDLSRFGRDYIETGRYRADYDAQEQALQAQLDKLRSSAQDDPLALPWVKDLLTLGHLTELDRPTVAAAIREISYVSMRETALRSTICSRKAAALCWGVSVLAFRFG